jgi:hypothetical protein
MVSLTKSGDAAKTGGEGREAWARFRYADYLGGVPELGKKCGGTLWFTVEAIGMGLGKPRHAVIPMSRVKSVEVTAEAPQIRGGVSFIAGMGAVSSREHVSIGAHLDSGEVAYFTADWLGVTKAKAALSPVLRAAGIPFHDEAPAGGVGGSASTADELGKLAQLRDQGVLTEEEFAAQKAKLLG